MNFSMKIKTKMLAVIMVFALQSPLGNAMDLSKTEGNQMRGNMCVDSIENFRAYLISAELIKLNPELKYADIDIFIDIFDSMCDTLKIGNTHGRTPFYTFPDSIGDLIDLKEIIITGTYMDELPDSFKNLINLNCLELTYNQFKKIPDCIRHLTSLTELDLRFNPLGCIGTEIRVLTNLKSLNLRGTELKSFTKEVGCFPCLEGLFLDKNKIEIFPDNIINFPCLTQLTLHQNNLTYLPPELSQHKKLKLLDISNNPGLGFYDRIPKKTYDDFTLFPFYINLLHSNIMVSLAFHNLNLHNIELGCFLILKDIQRTIHQFIIDLNHKDLLQSKK